MIEMIEIRLSEFLVCGLWLIAGFKLKMHEILLFEFLRYSV